MRPAGRGQAREGDYGVMTARPWCAGTGNTSGTPSPRCRASGRRSPSSSAGARGSISIDLEGRRYLDGVSSLWANVHGHRRRELDEALVAQLDAGGPQHPPGAGPPAGHRAGPPPGGDGAPGPHQGVLLGQRLHRGGGGPEAGLPVLAQPGPSRQAALPEARQRLPRRHPGGGVGGGHPLVPRDLPAPALRHPGGPGAVLLPLPAPGGLLPRSASRAGRAGGHASSRSWPRSSWSP